MEPNQSQDYRPKTIRTLRIAIVSAAVALGLVVLFETNRQPRTDDAEVLANFIGIAPQVEGPIARLSVRDNQFVKRESFFSRSTTGPFVTHSRERSPSRLHWKGRSRTTAERLPRSRAPCSWRKPITRVPRRI